MFERIIKGWNGKWHIWEDDLEVIPPEPVGPHNAVAKPERQKALTTCGEEILVREKRYEYPVRFYPPSRWQAPAEWRLDRTLTWCHRCDRVIEHRLIDKLEDLNRG